MPSRIIRYKERIEERCYSVFFPVYSPSHGIGFDCGADYVVNRESLNPAACQNFDMCMADHAGIMEKRTWLSARIIPGLMRCDCGRENLIYDHHDIDCDCGRSYTSGGSLLAPRSQWGEETGETAADYDAGVANPERAFEGDY